jgi:uncharacterized protein YndB with AHSA1/START domain
VDARTRDSDALTDGDAFAGTMPSDREIVFTRVFNAPRQVVFDAWTKPEHLRQWYGCSKSSMIVCEIDLRPGGSYRFVLRASGLPDFTISGVYREIVSPSRIVCTERFEDDGAKEALLAITFDERDDKTVLTSRALYRSAADRQAVLDLGVDQGAAESLDRLARYLSTLI